MSVAAVGSCHDFYPRSPCGERHGALKHVHQTEEISIHALLAESDAFRSPRIALMVGFLSTLSLRRATCYQYGRRWQPKIFLSTLSLRRATSAPVACGIASDARISIHALLAESDIYCHHCLGTAQHILISIHALLAESDQLLGMWLKLCQVSDFYPRSPCGERLTPAIACNLVAVAISIHALLAESDGLVLVPGAKIRISIHALLAESDRSALLLLPLSPTISIHALLAESDAEFFCVVYVLYISIHALLAESDPAAYGWKIGSKYFYPRSPCGERPSRAVYSSFVLLSDFYPRSPCGERLHSVPAYTRRRVYFYPRSPCGERLTQQRQRA